MKFKLVEQLNTDILKYITGVSTYEKLNESHKKLSDIPNDVIEEVWGVMRKCLNDTILKLSEDDVLKILSNELTDEMNTKSAMFITSAGKLISMYKWKKSPDNTHSDLGAILMKHFLSDYFSDNQEKSECFRLYLLSGVFHNEFGAEIVFDFCYRFNWIRINFGSRYIENRFYCVTPENRPTDVAFRKLDDCIQFGIENYKDNILIYCGDDNESESKAYNFNEYSADDIIKRIKRYYASGVLYEEKL